MAIISRIPMFHRSSLPQAAFPLAMREPRCAISCFQQNGALTRSISHQQRATFWDLCLLFAQRFLSLSLPLFDFSHFLSSYRALPLALSLERQERSLSLRVPRLGRENSNSYASFRGDRIRRGTTESCRTWSEKLPARWKTAAGGWLR